MLTVLSTFAVGAAIYDGAGRLLLADEAYGAIFHRPTSKLVGMSRDAVTHPDDRSRNLLLIDHFRADGKPFELAKRYLRTDGSYVWVQNRVSMLLGDEKARTLVLSRPLPEDDVRGATPSRAGRLSYAGVVSETAASMGYEARRFALRRTAELLDQVANAAIPEAQAAPDEMRECCYAGSLALSVGRRSLFIGDLATA